jgi:hypothetical protein
MLVVRISARAPSEHRVQRTVLPSPAYFDKTRLLKRQFSKPSVGLIRLQGRNQSSAGSRQKSACVALPIEAQNDELRARPECAIGHFYLDSFSHAPKCCTGA